MIKHYKYGLRDIAFAPDEEHSVWLAADAGAMQNLKSKLSFGLFGNKKDDKLGEGVVEGYHVKYDPSIEHNFKIEKLFKHTCDSPAICLQLVKDHPFFVVGYENGNIGMFAYEVSENQESIKETYNVKVHPKRILAVSVDPKKKLIYSISKSNQFKILDYLNKVVINGSLNS